MLLKTPSEKCYKFVFLTSTLFRHLKENSVPFHDLLTPAVLEKKLTFSEIAYLIKFQYTVASKIGMRLADPEIMFRKGYNFEPYVAGMIKEAFNAIDSEALLKTYSGCSQFNVLDAGGNVILVLFNEEKQRDVPGWDTLQGQTFSSALLEAISSKVGYRDCHLGKIPSMQDGYFTMAEVYKLLSIENP